MTTPDQQGRLSLPRRMSAQAHANLMDRLGDAYLTLPAEEKQRLRTREKDRLLTEAARAGEHLSDEEKVRLLTANAASTGNPLDQSGPWDADITTILADAGFPEGGLSWPGPIRRLMTSAWQHGYTTGMADAAALEQQAATAEHIIAIEGPIAYPGGKDGSYRARCKCGKYESDFGTQNEVRKSGAAHVRDKREDG